jgi:hypothetical protein
MKELKLKVSPERMPGECEGCYFESHCNCASDQVKVIDTTRYNCGKDSIVYVLDTDIKEGDSTTEPTTPQVGSIQAILDASNPMWLYGAMDKDGVVYLYDNKPYIEGVYWGDRGHSAVILDELLDESLLTKEWKESLVTRTGYKEEYICEFKRGQAVLVKGDKTTEERVRVFKEYKDDMFNVYPSDGIYTEECWTECRAFEIEEK